MILVHTLYKQNKIQPIMAADNLIQKKELIYNKKSLVQKNSNCSSCLFCTFSSVFAYERVDIGKKNPSEFSDMVSSVTALILHVFCTLITGILKKSSMPIYSSDGR